MEPGSAPETSIQTIRGCSEPPSLCGVRLLTESQTLASSSGPDEDQVTMDRCDHAGFIEYENPADPGILLNPFTNKRVCAGAGRNGVWRRPPGNVCHQLLVAHRELRMLGRTTPEHLEKSLDSISSPLDESRSFKTTRPGQLEAGVCTV